MRVFFLNNYSMRRALREVAAGEYPGHHLWGYPQRREGDQWVIPPSYYDFSLRSGGAASFVRRAIVRAVGDPVQQAHVMLRLRRGDVVYAADQQSAILLGVLARFRLLRGRYVVVVHHAPRHPLEKASLRGASHIGVLSEHVVTTLRAALGSAHPVPITILPWGPDTTSPIYTEAPRGAADLDFAAAGRTNRDYTNLREAAQAARLNGVIFDRLGRSTFRNGSVEFTPGRAKYADVTAVMARARCVVIPFKDPGVMAGLTEVADAIALDVPMVVSRSPAFPYDLERHNAGVYLESGSSEEILEKIRLAQAGQLPSPRPLADLYDIDIFGDALNRLLHDEV